MADREDERFQAAAARWHARFVLEAGLPLREAEAVTTLLWRVRGADRHVVRTTREKCMTVKVSDPATIRYVARILASARHLPPEA